MANLPVALSSLYQLPMITYTLKDSDQIAILTANADMLKKSQAWLNLEAKLSDHKGTQNSRFVLVGLKDMRGFDAITNGTEENVPLIK